MIDKLSSKDSLDVQKWFVIKTNSRAEKKVEERLQKLGFEVFYRYKLVKNNGVIEKKGFYTFSFIQLVYSFV